MTLMITEKQEQDVKEMNNFSETDNSGLVTVTQLMNDAEDALANYSRLPIGTGEFEQEDRIHEVEKSFRYL